MKILVTGGAGYIGSHTCIELINSGYEIVVIDNLCNSSQESIRRVEKLSKSDIPFYNIDIRNKVELTKIFEKYSFEGVIHFAGLKAVGESVKNPFAYYNNNVVGTFILIEVMRNYNCNTFVFSSSATVYGDTNILPIKEDFKGNKNFNSNLLIAAVLANLTALVILLILGKFLWNNYLTKMVTVVNPIDSVFDLLALSILINLLVGN